MKNISRVLLLVLLLTLFTTPIMAYNSDRHDFGNVDFGGATVTLVAWYDPMEGFYEGGDYAGRLEEAKELFNIGDVEYLEVPWGAEGREMCMSRFLAGDSDYDLWMLPHESFFPMRAAGALYPVSDFLGDDYYEKMPYQHERMSEVLGLGGKKYTFSVFNGINNNTVFLAFNKTLLEREGIQDPYELYDNDQWDWDTLTDILIRVTRDTSNDGEVDQWGLTVFNGPDWIHANGGNIYREVDGKIAFTADEPAAVNALRQMREWEHELNVVGGSWEKNRFFNGEIAFANLPSWQIGQLRESMEDDYGVVPLPLGPDADGYHFPSDNVDSLYIPANAAQPQALVALDNFLWPVEEFEIAQEEGIINQAPDSKAYEILKYGIANWTGEAAYMSWAIGRYYESAWGACYEAIMSGEKTPAAATAEIKPEAQALLDDALNQ
ncbi:MAG TPA: extracellular solute-binding protein [Halanaerobiales bacterium]|nr:extracellular solute-binding protein [Halanaerobiales bacterium]